MSGKPRLLVIERETPEGSDVRRALAEHYEVVTARSMTRALGLLRQQEFAGVFVDAAQLSAVRWAGVLIQADEILDAIADGVAVVDAGLSIVWANPEFVQLVPAGIDPVGTNFYKALGNPESLGPERCAFRTAASTGIPQHVSLKLSGNRYLRVTVTPTSENGGQVPHLIALTREVTQEVLQQQKIDAIHQAGDQLADLTPEDLAEMNVEDRKALLKYNIVRHMRDLLGLDFIEIRLLERETRRLVPLLTEGMLPQAAQRELFAQPEDNGVTGYVAATGQSYLCTDTTCDPRYLEGAADARSSLTVPLLHAGAVIGTLNVESAQAHAFDERDRQFLEIYARSVAAALTTLELLSAEQRQVATDAVEAFSRELALPLDDILGDATTVLDRYGGHDEELVERLKHLLRRAREIRSLIPKVGLALVPDAGPAQREHPGKLKDARVLVVDAEEPTRRAAQSMLGREGAVVETAQDARVALALARQSPYAVALVDIRLPDMEGYDVYARLREIQPGLPVVLMTGFGYDPTHAIVKARREGLQSVLYKPFRADQLLEVVRQALHSSPANAPARDGPQDGRGPEPGGAAP